MLPTSAYLTLRLPLEFVLTLSKATLGLQDFQDLITH
jgi:hypothetical protein